MRNVEGAFDTDIPLSKFYGNQKMKVFFTEK